MSALAQAARSRYGPTAQRRLPGARQHFVALMFWIVVPIFCLFALVSGVDKLARHIDNVPAGVPGTFVVTLHNCAQELCVTVGTFTSDDGHLVEPNQIGLYSWQIGESHPAVFDASSTDVIPLPAQWDASSTVVGMAGALGFMGLWGICLYGSVRRRSPAVQAVAAAAAETR
ncbi:MAG TPA: hypothetical protein VK816_07035 [Jatrophihabitantaceae bacterium]|jgi:hypothetical protein|nr:hypothetical protein [Jatrophihabitantaceae bacterium]